MIAAVSTDDLLGVATRGLIVMQERHQGVQLGRWVRERRQALNLTQEQVWARMEIEGDANWLAHLESGRRKSLPDTDYLIGIAQALRVSVTDVLRGAGVLPVDLEEASTEAPGSHTIHALVDAIDWTSQPHRREVAESLLRTFLEQDQRVSRPSKESAGSARGAR